MLGVRGVFDRPVASLRKADDADSDPNQLSSIIYNVDEIDHPADRDIADRIVAALESTVNLVEPFNRIREALRDALKDGSIRNGTTHEDQRASGTEVRL